jgi:ankyrin repeat protein
VKVSFKKRLDSLKVAFDYHDNAYKTHSRNEKFIRDNIELLDLDADKLQSCVKDMTSESIVISNMYSASMAGDIDKVSDYLKMDIDINEHFESGWTALLAASAQGFMPIVKLLLEHGANPDISNFNKITPLLYAVRYNNYEICSLLLEYGSDVNLQDIYGNSPLIGAAKNGKMEIVELLLSYGANVDIQDHEKLKALDYAQKFKNGQVAKRLRNIRK